MSSNAEYLKVSAILEAVFGNQPVTKHHIYMDLLADYDYDDLKAAVTRCATELNQYPTIREIIERVPSFIPDDLIGNRIIERLKGYCENGWFYVRHDETISAGQRIFDPDYLALLDLVGGIERLDKSYEDPAAMERLRKDFVKVCSQSVIPTKVRAEIRARRLEGNQTDKIDLLIRSKLEERRQLQAPQNNS